MQKPILIWVNATSSSRETYNSKSVTRNLLEKIMDIIQNITLWFFK